ncbi:MULTISPECIES: hypothetical protein [Aliarcobacter]|nr:hypothetical protein [Aliarcobacter cryaerophilus]MBK6303611.1 hypothetical protein [Arcobacter sp.]MCT7492603.1 hypothetical protein [Aliarcobacter cryaerophilus]MCT7506560.1 hypothetical protein [Aliarcobacter cryaerophilus]MCT7506976.1 hypothetical protein [Aliarcobacter cryaerophilus]MCT7514649.1 hypothetical protein [Aliarcobacter cryaerophilus]
MRYFFKFFFIYLLLIFGLLYILADENINDLSGNDVDSTVEFVYEEF